MTTTNQTITDSWTLISTTVALLQCNGNSGCLIYVGGTAPTSSSAFIMLSDGDTYTYAPTSDTLYARANSGLTVTITIIK